jgi:hypothetical protein
MNEVTKPIDQDALRRLVISGDISKLSVEQRDEYYVALCDACGIDWRLRPFDYIVLNGKMTLYANRNCAEQLRQRHRISISITDRSLDGDIFIVTARAEMNGRYDESTGAVVIGGLKGDAKANAIMKAETKAKRRVTLSIAGTGMLDETETETIPNAHKVEPKDITPKPEISEAQKEFERQKGITSEPLEAEPEPTETPEAKAKRELGEQRAAFMNRMPEDVQNYFRAFTKSGKKIGDWFKIVADNMEDVEQIRGYMKDHPLNGAVPSVMVAQGEEGLPQ